MTKQTNKTKQLTMLGLMIGILVLMAYTPLGYLNIGPLATGMILKVIANGPMFK